MHKGRIFVGLGVTVSAFECGTGFFVLILSGFKIFYGFYLSLYVSLSLS
jgi:hypothetical protein